MTREEVAINVGRARSGDREAFARLYNAFSFLVIMLLCRKGCGRQDAEDCCQEAFMRAMSAIQSLRKFDSFPSWVGGIALRVMLNLRRKKRIPLLDNQALEIAGSSQNDPIKKLLADEEARMAKEALAGLNPIEREMLEMRYFEGLSVSEIARKYKLPEGTARSRLSRARKSFARKWPKAI